jgi:hypothetical protein
MRRCKQSGFALPFSIAVSAFGFLMILALAVSGRGSTITATWRKPVVGSVFALVCLLGIVLAESPRKCSETYGHRRSMRKTNLPAHASSFVVKMKGHHHDCGMFTTHTIQVSGHVLCAACTGLILGALVALFGTAVYFFAQFDWPQFGLFAVGIGVLAMTLGFLQLKFESFARLMVNMLFVLGGFLILVGMDELTGSLFADLFSIVLIVFWLFTRILLSQWDHWKICRKCGNVCDISGEANES